jgi:(1->4)-alpha-D-glucan 1-alpha-D-glucosylmutase
MLNRISESDRRYRDFTVNGLRNAIREVIASYTVYRTYVTPDQTEPERRDRSIVEVAVKEAKRRNPDTDPSTFDFLRDILLLRGSEGLNDEASQARWDFVMKFQQVTGPVAAKGVEDTALYTYNRLVSLNEVGGEPDIFGITPAQFHEAQLARLRQWPHSMLATSTHDTKRSEDLRARIDVLSEMPKAWRVAVRRWARLNRKYKSKIDGRPVPDANEEYLLYQTLVGVWPFGVPSDSEKRGARYSVPGTGKVIERVQEYMRKALNEAKVHTSWINTNEEYLGAVSRFVASILRAGEDNRFLPDFVPFQQRIARLGAFNSLSQLLLKLTSPGVPDIYQGTELWDLSLVDPDNRRPVDYASRRKLLTQVDRVQDAKGAARLLESLEDGRIKLFVMSRTLRFRGEHRALFDDGEYVPLEAEGKRSDCVVAFARHSASDKNKKGKTVLVVVPRFITRLQNEGPGEVANPVGEMWKGSELVLPEDAFSGAKVRFRNVFTGEIIEARMAGGRSRLALDEVFATLPLALLETV